MTSKANCSGNDNSKTMTLVYVFLLIKLHLTINLPVFEGELFERAERFADRVMVCLPHSSRGLSPKFSIYTARTIPPTITVEVEIYD